MEWHKTVDELKDDKEAQKAVLCEMLRRLEIKGECSGHFHNLAFVLFGDNCSDGMIE